MGNNMSAKKGISSTGLLTIDLGAIAANWVYLDRHVGEHCRCAAVVKANAYGLGVVPVATSLWNAGCRVFFVATVVEAKELRAALPYDYQIIVLGGLSHDQGDGCSADWLNYQLMPMLFSVSDVSRWYDFCSSVQQNLPSAIKVDTGMHRLGLQPQECQQLFAEGVLQAVNPTYIMSHLACADQPHHPLNRQQISCFQWLEEQCKMLLPNAQLSLCNSAGIFLGEEVHYDVVRPGIALYGANPSADENPMSPVVQITLPIMQVKTIAEGESVGYGAEFVAQRETRIGIVFGGYADGLQRSLAHAGFAFCGGVKVPLIGRVSMDSMAFDLSDRLEAITSKL
jgi:alanine racemase